MSEKATREEVETMLETVDQQISQAPEGGLHGAYSTATEWFFDVEMDPDVASLASRGLAAIRTKYELD